MKSILPRLSLPILVSSVAAAIAAAGPDDLSRQDKPAGQNASPYVVSSRARARPESGAREPAIEKLPPGDRLLVQAIHQLERRESVNARMRFQVRLGEDVLAGMGRYWQQGAGDALRIRLDLQVLGQETQLLQVSNSRFLWIDRRLPTGRTVSRIDLRQLRADPSFAASRASQPVQPGQASWSPLNPELSAHAGGLPTLLSALQKNFAFQAPQAMRLALEKSSETAATTIPVFAVVGHWKPERLASLVERAQASQGASGPEPPDEPTDSIDDESRALRSLPPRIPQEVLLLVGQADSFPYWIEYRRLETPLTPSAGGQAIPYQLSASPLVVLELSDVYFDKPIPTGRFDYSPGEVDWIDQTAQRIEQLRR